MTPSESQYESIDPSTLEKFTDLPLSSKTVTGLRKCNYTKLTAIQKESIYLALQGKDVLAAAQTGSGKTLAFLIPVLEKLHSEKWTKFDGTGALIITPTRELAYQIFETLRKVGQSHDFSAGLIIGGKDLKFEKKRMDQCNIIVCTPGRLLQHMDENPLFTCVNVKILVLDEADRCLDMGFKDTMDAIIANLPPKRQTLLFSATQTKSVKDLARLSLKDASYVSVHELTTPKELQQTYVVCELHDKLSILWSFIRNHLKQKIIVFFATCKQVKYAYEMFCKLRPGMSLIALYGTLHQLRRMKIYEDFCSKKSAVLFATDLAARGLDFPQVHWVVQVDCPEDVDTYIHRVGRTARYHRNGESFLMLMPSELKMLDYLAEKKIPIEEIDINPSKLQNPLVKMQIYLSTNESLKDTAQRAFMHYARAIYYMKHKEIFNIKALDFAAYSKSLGLTVVPRIRFLDRIKKNEGQTNINKKQNNKIYFDDEDDKNGDKLSSSNVEKDASDDAEASNDSEDELGSLSIPSNFNFGQIKSTDKCKDLFIGYNKWNLEGELPADLKEHQPTKHNKKPITKADIAKQVQRKKVVVNKKMVFNDEGDPVIKNAAASLAQTNQCEQQDNDGINIQMAIEAIKEADKVDKNMFKERQKIKRREEKRKLKGKSKSQESEDEKDEFGEDSDSGEVPDLSWLPNPDKIYGEQGDEGEIDNDIGEKVEEQKEVKKKSNKRKDKNKDENSLKRKKRKIEKISAELSVNQAEELALALLRR